MRLREQEAAIVLVNMPWAPPTEPSLGLSILKASLLQNGYQCKILHAAPKLLKWLTIETYAFLAECWAIDEFVFTAVLDPICDEKQLKAIIASSEIYEQKKVHPVYRKVDDFCSLFLTVRHKVIPAFLEDCREEVLSHNPKLVGFSCMFDQTIASVALSKLLKESLPNLKIILGGYALEGKAANEVVRCFPWIEHIVQGDGEKIIIDLARHYLTEDPTRALVTYPPIIKTSKINLNESPNPNYDDWFDDLKYYKEIHKIMIEPEILPVESSRGCWWGQSKHCIFCGIDDETMKYRYKEPEIAFNMLDELRKKYGNLQFRFSDYIMPKAYYDTLLLKLANHTPKFKLQSEIKANHPKERVQALAEAGFSEVQPGIESFSTSVLKSMDKGVTSIENVKLLKYGYLFGIDVYYNFLYGLPDDKLEDYLEMIQTIPSIYHFTPPISRSETIITKFAPLQQDPQRFGLSGKATHHRSYDSLFSDSFLKRTGFNLDEYAYYFERNFEFGYGLEELYLCIITQINHWKKLHQDRFVELSFVESENGYAFVDTRFRIFEEYFISGIEAKIYKILDEKPVKRRTIPECLLNDFGAVISEDELEACLQHLQERRLIWIDGESIFGLAVPKHVSDRHMATEWNKSWSSIYL